MDSRTHNRHKLHLLSLVQLLCPLLVQLFPNCTRIHVITYTNTFLYLCLLRINFLFASKYFVFAPVDVLVFVFVANCVADVPPARA